MITNKQFREIKFNDVQTGTLVCFDPDWIYQHVRFKRCSEVALLSSHPDTHWTKRVYVLVDVKNVVVGVVAGKAETDVIVAGGRQWIKVLFGMTFIYVTPYMIMECFKGGRNHCHIAAS